jgi:2,3-bisphosphoglycerate-independent phosphoglycerate mutase
VIRENRHPFVRLNYPNGDMVGHTGVYQAAQIAVECVDLGVGRLMRAVRDVGGILVVTADHGNSDDMYEHDRKTGATKRDAETGEPVSKTSHSLNPVPLHIYDPAGGGRWERAEVPKPGITNLTATCLTLLGYEPPAEYDASLVRAARKGGASR